MLRFRVFGFRGYFLLRASNFPYDLDLHDHIDLGTCATKTARGGGGGLLGRPEDVRISSLRFRV